MLVTSRTTADGQSRLVIDGKYVVQLCEVRSAGKIRIGVFAPRSVEIHREEVFDAINGAGSTAKLVERIREDQSR